MKLLKTIGTSDETYTPRPTVKAIVTHNNKLLILNDGLLPGGGVEEGEDAMTALKRELQEELGASVGTIQPIGRVVQYRSFLKKKYIVDGYTCELLDFDLEAAPQNEGEKNFIVRWLDRDDALALVNESIARYDAQKESGTTQGKLFNIQTTQAFLTELR